jgi:hypothetical protein
MTESETVNLKLGQFIVYEYVDNKLEPFVVSQLSQDELAEGWKLVLPSKKHYSTIHHFSVYLSQLPSHLWTKVHFNVKNDESNYYKKIKDNIYEYSVKRSKYDYDVLRLYRELNKVSPNKQLIDYLYHSLEVNNVRGWLMLRAKQYLKSRTPPQTKKVSA